MKLFYKLLNYRLLKLIGKTKSYWEEPIPLLMLSSKRYSDLDMAVSPRFREPNVLFNSFFMGRKMDIETGDTVMDIYDLTRIKIKSQPWPDMLGNMWHRNNITEAYNDYEIVKNKKPSLFKKVLNGILGPT